MDKKRNQNNKIKIIYIDLLTDILDEEISVKTVSRRTSAQVEGLFAPPSYADTLLIKIQRFRGGKILAPQKEIKNHLWGIEGFINDGNIFSLERELIILAHEFGHYKSYKSGHRSPKLEEACRLLISAGTEGITSSHKKLIVEEEEVAWIYAHQILQQKGYENWDAFESIKEDCLSAYRSLLRTVHVSRNWFVNRRSHSLSNEQKTIEFSKKINKIYVDTKKILMM